MQLRHLNLRFLVSLSFLKKTGVRDGQPLLKVVGMLTLDFHRFPIYLDVRLELLESVGKEIIVHRDLIHDFGELLSQRGHLLLLERTSGTDWRR